MTEKTVIRRTRSQPATVHSLAADLTELGVRSGSTLLVHSSLSSLGWVCGGAVAVIEALQQATGPNGTIVMPAHTNHVSDPANWENPPVPQDWWPLIRRHMPVFDPHITPTRAMGAIAECFRSSPASLRSCHPQVSFSASGPQAESIVASHVLEDGLGEGSPLARLYDCQADVLLLGVGHEHNTSLHLAEMRVKNGHVPRRSEGAPLMIDGKREWVQFRDPELDSTSFPEVGQAFRKHSSHLRAGKVALAESQLMPMSPLVDFAVQWFRNAEQTH